MFVQVTEGQTKDCSKVSSHSHGKASSASPVPRGTLPLRLIGPGSESTVAGALELRQGDSEW